MTDRSGLLGDWRAVLAGGLAVLTGAVLTLVVRTGNPATADSFLVEVRDTAVTLSDGTLVVGHDGLRVPDGATVRTGPTGGARLSTAGRDVYLGALTTVSVTNGVRQVLERGQVMVDGRGGPRLAVGTRAGWAEVSHDSLVRVELGPVLRLGVLAGSASLTAAGRQVTTRVPALYQVLAPYAGLPGRTTPLALTDDPWEQRLAAELVNADKDLTALARGLTGADGQTVLLSAPVALRRIDTTVFAATSDRGERALSTAVAQVSRRDAPLPDTLSFVTSARNEGGSWGVVAALVEARVTAVSALLDTVLAPPGSTPPPVIAGASPVLPNGFSPAPTASGTVGGPSPSSPSPSGPRPSRTPSPKPPGPSPTAPADDLITTITNLLSPSATPTSATSTKSPLIHLPLVSP